jgi:hypothetical protein
MNWKEFKDFVESKGVTDDMKVDTIDVTRIDNSNESTRVEVYPEDNKEGIIILN